MFRRISLALDWLGDVIGPYGNLPFAPESMSDFAAHLRAQYVPEHISAALAYGLAFLTGRAANTHGLYAQAHNLDHIIAHAQRLILLGPMRIPNSLY